MAAKKFLIVKLLIVLAAAGGLAWWIAVGPVVNIDRTYDGVLWRSHDASLCAPVTVQRSSTSQRARPFCRISARFCSTVWGVSAPHSRASSGQNRLRGWP